MVSYYGEKHNHKNKADYALESVLMFLNRLSINKWRAGVAECDFSQCKIMAVYESREFPAHGLHIYIHIPPMVHPTASIFPGP